MDRPPAKGLEPSLAAAFIDGSRGDGFSPHRFVGCRLRRFSLWHLFLLQTIASPFVRLGDVTLWDLLTAVGICRLRFDDSRIVRPWLGPVTLCRLARKGGLHREVMRFLAYTGDYLQKPEYCIHTREVQGSAPSPQRSSAPELLTLAADIMGWCRAPERWVWELPPGRAYWYRSMAQRALGADVDFMNEEERAFQDQMEAAGMKPGRGRS